jgi:hypothetical protein
MGQGANGRGNSMQRLFAKAAQSAVTGITFVSEKQIEAELTGSSGIPDYPTKPRNETAKLDWMASREKSLLLRARRDGETGRRSGLKIRRPERVVGVQVPLPAPIIYFIIMYLKLISWLFLRCENLLGLAGDTFGDTLFRDMSSRDTYGFYGKEGYPGACDRKSYFFRLFAGNVFVLTNLHSL